MILRILNLVVIGALILAAAYVYRIKFEFDRAGRAARQNPRRGAARARRHRRACAPNGASSKIRRASRRSPSAYLPLKPIAPTQFDTAQSTARTPAAIRQARQSRSDRRSHRESGRAGRATGSIERQSGPAPANVAPADAVPADTAPAGAASADDASADMMPSDTTPSDNAADEAGEEEAPAAESGRLDR